MRKKALFIVDPQLDFMPGGSLAVPFGDRIVPIINDILNKFEIVIVSRDWHPDDHKSFTSNNPGTNVLDIVKVNDKDMIIWPPHCVQYTEGANFHPDLQLYGVPIFTKGDKNDEHPFSGFVGVNDDGISVKKYFIDNEVDEVYVVGLAGDYCVKDTALDCAEHFKTYFVVDATRFIGEMNPTLEELVSKNVIVINSIDLDLLLSNDNFYGKDDKNLGLKYLKLKKNRL